ncbi:MAG: hypothetical protein ACI8RE_000032 [Ilumatobacter sp.]|jgi:hypothetical protein
MGSERVLGSEGKTFVESPVEVKTLYGLGDVQVHLKVAMRRAGGESLGVHSGHGEPGRIDR